MIATRPTGLGFAMDGMTEAISEIVEGVCTNFDRVTYIEIGVGHGKTLVGLAMVISDLKEDWRAIGLELPAGYSFNRKATQNNGLRAGFKLDFIENTGVVNFSPAWNTVSVILENSQTFLAEHWREQIQLALIDGCHGKKCATLDFLLLEPFIPEGGIIMFHDFGEDQIGQEQPHCGTLDVRGACQDLGLLDDQRPGWRFLDTIIGNKQAGSGDMGVFQRTSTGTQSQ